MTPAVSASESASMPGRHETPISPASRASSPVVSSTRRFSSRWPAMTTIAATSAQTRTSEPTRSRFASVTHHPCQRSWGARLFAAKPVTEATHRFDQSTGNAELCAQSLHVHVHRARLDVWRCFPHGFQEMSTSLHTAAALSERQQQPILGGGQFDLFSVDGNAVLAPVDANRADGENVRTAGGAGAHASQNRADAEHQLLRAEGLREIIIGAEGETANAIELLSAS